MFRFTIRDLLWLIVVVAVALAIYFVRPRQTQWEYKTETVQWYNFDPGVRGKEGWELIQVDTDGNLRVLYFKRPR